MCGGGCSSIWKKGQLAIVSYNLATMDENDWGRASPQLLLSSNLVPFLENCTGQRRKIIVHSVSAEILSIANFITLFYIPWFKSWNAMIFSYVGFPDLIKNTASTPFSFERYFFSPFSLDCGVVVSGTYANPVSNLGS